MIVVISIVVMGCYHHQYHCYHMVVIILSTFVHIHTEFSNLQNAYLNKCFILFPLTVSDCKNDINLI